MIDYFIAAVFVAIFIAIWKTKDIFDKDNWPDC